MGQGASEESKAGSTAGGRPLSLKSTHSTASFGSEMGMLTDEETRRETQRVRMRMKTFRAKAGTQEICTQLYSSWKAERERVCATWLGLTDPGRRALIMDAREKVVKRGRILHSVFAPQTISMQVKTNIVRKLMEKTSFELFDTGVLYGDESLPQLIETVLSQGGGGKEIPFGLLLEVNNTFDECRPQSPSTSERNDFFEFFGLNTALSSSDSESEDASPGTGTSGIAGEAMDRPSTIPVTDANGKTSPVLVDSRSNSLNSLQGYYRHNETTTKKGKSRRPSSKSIRNLLNFVPEGLDPITRRNLTLELLMEMRHAMLVHFAILVFSELFDDKLSVLHKFEYDSDSETDAGRDSATDCEEIEEEEEDDDDDDGEEEENKDGQEEATQPKAKDASQQGGATA